MSRPLFIYPLNKPIRIRTFYVMLVLSCMLVFNFVSYLLVPMQTMWCNSYVLIIFHILLILINIRMLPAKHFSWINIFVVLVAIFHLGYYIPASLGFVDELSYLPSLNDHNLPLGLTIYVTALLCFEVGAILANHLLSRPNCKKDNPESYKIRDIKVIMNLGKVVLFGSVILFVIYLMQLGGIKSLFNLSYSDYNQFLSNRDSRFSAISITYIPVGFLLLFIGIRCGKSQNNKSQNLFVILGLLLFILWLLWVGNRGMALLVLLALCYLNYLLGGKINKIQIISLILIIFLIIPIIKSIRNIPVIMRGEYLGNINIKPFDAFVEMGGIIRPYLGFIDLFSSGAFPRLGMKPYGIAFLRLMPNIGAYSRQLSYYDFYRSNVWITRALDPSSETTGIGLGSSGIVEPYVCFGVLGVVIFFISLGYLISQLEYRVLVLKSLFCAGLISFLFIPICWYIRDDIYGTLRQLVWGCFAVIIAYLLSGYRSGKVR